MCEHRAVSYVSKRNIKCRSCFEEIPRGEELIGSQFVDTAANYESMSSDFFICKSCGVKIGKIAKEINVVYKVPVLQKEDWPFVRMVLQGSPFNDRVDDVWKMHITGVTNGGKSLLAKFVVGVYAGCDEVWTLDFRFGCKFRLRDTIGKNLYFSRRNFCQFPDRNILCGVNINPYIEDFGFTID